MESGGNLLESTLFGRWLGALIHLSAKFNVSPQSWKVCCCKKLSDKLLVDQPLARGL